jgi:hypothetical protein
MSSFLSSPYRLPHTHPSNAIQCLHFSKAFAKKKSSRGMLKQQLKSKAGIQNANIMAKTYGHPNWEAQKKKLHKVELEKEEKRRRVEELEKQKALDLAKKREANIASIAQFQDCFVADEDSDEDDSDEGGDEDGAGSQVGSTPAENDTGKVVGSGGNEAVLVAVPESTPTAQKEAPTEAKMSSNEAGPDHTKNGGEFGGLEGGSGEESATAGDGAVVAVQKGTTKESGDKMESPAESTGDAGKSDTDAVIETGVKDAEVVASASEVGEDVSTATESTTAGEGVSADFGGYCTDDGAEDPSDSTESVTQTSKTAAEEANSNADASALPKSDEKVVAFVPFPCVSCWKKLGEERGGKEGRGGRRGERRGK